MTRRILVPFELPDAAPISRLLVERLTGVDVVLLGHYTLPEQTPPEAARDQFGSAARAELDALAADFAAAGVDVETRLMFGSDRGKAIDQVAIETDCIAELVPAPTERIERILVPLLDTANLERLAFFVRTLLKDTTTEVTLFHAAEGTETVSEAEAVLEEARTALVDRGFDPDRLAVAAADTDDHDSAILQMVPEYDAVVMDEADANVAERIFGTLPQRIADRRSVPMFLVRRVR